MAPAGFAPCPELRPQNETDFLLCNPVRVNTQRCSTTQEMALTRCRLFETCDQALLLSGGWDRLSSPVAGGLANLRDVYAMLTRFGFKSNNVRAFYANGADGRYGEGSFWCGSTLYIFPRKMPSRWAVDAASAIQQVRAICACSQRVPQPSGQRWQLAEDVYWNGLYSRSQTMWREPPPDLNGSTVSIHPEVPKRTQRRIRCGH